MPIRGGNSPELEDKMSIEDIRFPWEYTDEEIAEISEEIGERGRCIDYQQDAYCDVHIFEDGHEERLYICD